MRLKKMPPGKAKRQKQGAFPLYEVGGLFIPPGHMGKKNIKPVFTEVLDGLEVGAFLATVDRWVDGDTVDLRVSLEFLGLSAVAKPRARLYGVDTPERGDDGYYEATRRAKELAPEGSLVRVQTYVTADKYGRLLAEVFTEDGSVNVGMTLVEEGLGRAYLGGKREPWDEFLL